MNFVSLNHEDGMRKKVTLISLNPLNAGLFCQSCCILLTFSQTNFFKTLFQEYHQKVTQTFRLHVRHDFGPNCKWFNNQTRGGSRISGRGFV